MIPKVSPFEAYKSYLGLKNHFTRESYDYHKYCGKSRASLQSFYKRKDRFFFEKLSRQKDDSEVVEFFVSNFVTCDDPQSLWIGEIVRNGEQNYTDWKRKLQSLTYTFKTEVENIFDGKNFDKKLQDPVWKFLSMRMDKYDSFLHIDVFKYKKILKQVVCGE